MPALSRSLALCCCLSLCWVALVPADARAQSLPPDVVQLRDGRLYRGALAPPDAPGVVVLVLQDGQRRRFARREVLHAGPAEEAAAARPPDPGDVAERDVVRFRFVAADGEPMTLYARTFERGALAQAPFAPLCTAPCDVALPKASTHQLAVSAYGAAAQPVPGGVALYDGATLRGVRTSNATTRVVLGAVGVGMAVLGGAWLTRLDDRPVHGQVGGLLGGSALLGGGLGLGLVGLILPDAVTLETE